MRFGLTLTLLIGTASMMGCTLFFGDDDCEYGGLGYDEAYPGIAAPGQRNPVTGECEYFYGGGGGCDECGNCEDVPAATTTEADRAPAEALPTWGYCESLCTGLGESTCQATPGCRAVYVDGVPPLFQECWATDQTGPVQGGACEGLDAYACSAHDDCIAIHEDNCGLTPGAAIPGEEPLLANCIGAFVRCGAEQIGCYGNDECGDGFHCNAAEICGPAPDCQPTDSCDAVCYGYCVPNVPPDAGTCYGEASCPTLPPACPSGTTPGIKDGCYTGYCIPFSECEIQMACTGIPSEATCIARFDCTPLYKGADCTCDSNGNNCVCQTLEFTGCVGGPVDTQ